MATNDEIDVEGTGDDISMLVGNFLVEDSSDDQDSDINPLGGEANAVDANMDPNADGADLDADAGAKTHDEDSDNFVPPNDLDNPIFDNVMVDEDPYEQAMRERDEREAAGDATDSDDEPIVSAAPVAGDADDIKSAGLPDDSDDEKSIDKKSGKKSDENESDKKQRKMTQTEFLEYQNQINRRAYELFVENSELHIWNKKYVRLFEVQARILAACSVQMADVIARSCSLRFGAMDRLVRGEPYIITLSKRITEIRQGFPMSQVIYPKRHQYFVLKTQGDIDEENLVKAEADEVNAFVVSESSDESGSSSDSEDSGDGAGAENVFDENASAENIMDSEKDRSDVEDVNREEKKFDDRGSVGSVNRNENLFDFRGSNYKPLWKRRRFHENNHGHLRKHNRKFSRNVVRDLPHNSGNFLIQEMGQLMAGAISNLGKLFLKQQPIPKIDKTHEQKIREKAELAVTNETAKAGIKAKLIFTGSFSGDEDKKEDRALSAMYFIKQGTEFVTINKFDNAFSGAYGLQIILLKLSGKAKARWDKVDKIENQFEQFSDWVQKWFIKQWPIEDIVKATKKRCKKWHAENDASLLNMFTGLYALKKDHDLACSYATDEEKESVLLKPANYARIGYHGLPKATKKRIRDGIKDAKFGVFKTLTSLQLQLDLWHKANKAVDIMEYDPENDTTSAAKYQPNFGTPVKGNSVQAIMQRGFKKGAKKERSKHKKWKRDFKKDIQNRYQKQYGAKNGNFNNYGDGRGQQRLQKPNFQTRAKPNFNSGGGGVGRDLSIKYKGKWISEDVQTLTAAKLNRKGFQCYNCQKHGHIANNCIYLKEKRNSVYQELCRIGVSGKTIVNAMSQQSGSGDGSQVNTGRANKRRRQKARKLLLAQQALNINTDNTGGDSGDTIISTVVQGDSKAEPKDDKRADSFDGIGIERLFAMVKATDTEDEF